MVELLRTVKENASMMWGNRGCLCLASSYSEDVNEKMRWYHTAAEEFIIQNDDYH